LIKEVVMVIKDGFIGSGDYTGPDDTGEFTGP